MTFPAHVISFLVGFLSLGAETLWVRTYAFANQSTPHALAIVLALFLLGIARGAAIGGARCAKAADPGARNVVDVATVGILAASGTLILSPVLMTVLPAPLLVLPVLIFLPAMFFSICFPICHHLGTVSGTGQTGRSLSRVYAANIAGSMCGPLVVNFGLLQVATTQTAFVVIGAAGIGLAAVLALRNAPGTRLAQAGLGGAAFAAASLGIVAFAPNLLMMELAAYPDPIRHIVETRQGIIVSHADDAKGDVIFGGNVYDGRTNTDPRINSNGINRIIMLAALQPKPKRVLVIGLSVGTWQHIIGGFPGVEHMDVIEINPGYLELASHYDAQKRAVADPRVNLIIGDGRKFLRQNPEVRYDLVVMNTTWHWRMYTSLLLSREFMSLLKSHMGETAVLAFNATGSGDALKTAAAVFPHAYLYDSFVVAGPFDWRQTIRAPAAVAALRAIKPAGVPLFGPKDDDIITDFLAEHRATDQAQAQAKTGRPLEVITDRNLITEYRYGRMALKLW